MSDTDGTFNFLISMIYTQMFNLLCEKADDVYGGRLPVHVRCLIDEAANIGQIPNLEKLVATIRSREISACLVLQAKSQLKAIYKDNADTIIGNMDSQIFLGGTEQTTLKDLNVILGKETIDMYNTGQSKGSQESYNMNYQKLGKDITEMLADEMSVVIRIPDIIIVTLYIESQMSFKPNRTRALIAAHGYATASSMANVANRILNGRIYDSFDMPIECNAQEMQHNIEQYIRTYCTEKGMVLLVDMGSLEHVYEPALSAIKGPVLLVNNISTQMAIHIGTLIDEGCPVVEMIDQIKDANIPEVKLFYPREKKGKAILSFCFTGDATAKQIKEMLQKCIPEELNIHILDCDFESLKKNGKDFSAFRFYDVLGIIGTTDIEIKDVEYISLESLIMGTAEEQLLEMFDGIADRDIIKEINDNVVRNCSIERLLDTLTILDTNKIVLNIDKCLHRYEKFSGEELNNSKKAWSFLHVSCMVERLIRRQPINTYANLEKFSGDAEKELNIIKQSFAMLEKEYQIEIPLSELGYIYDILMS